VPTIAIVDIAVVVAALLAGSLLGAVIVVLLSRRAGAPPVAPMPPAGATSAALSRRMVEVIRHGAVVVDAGGEVVLANAAAKAMAVVRSGHLAVPDLRSLVSACQEDQEARQAIVDLPGGRLGREPIAVLVQAAPLDDDERHVALLIEDVTESRRLEAVRRDFVANVSHELKTPVGALTLLAEAVADAADEPAEVRRFAQRMQKEGSRLGRLVTELIELSRLQGAEPLPDAKIVSVERVVAEAVDRTRLAADQAGITVVSGGERGLAVRGNESQLITALVNLVDNAIAYSADGTRVAVGMRRRAGNPDDGGDSVEISVSDQGIGIAETDLERVFERFYRADPARSRATGGTGLGLAIVKHIATNHGGSVSVWSVEGSGSTFTVRLPAAGRNAPYPAPNDPRTAVAEPLRVERG
jgi:two-component system, OmpR family, sensor histidine kinase SenX3